MKRVGCLYRVSCKKQVSDEDDIPMQKTACTEFAEQNGWVIVREFLEKGISGYKVSMQDRDALQDLKKSALNQEFDVLLVFMFDRLGRREDETPFIVEWFVKHGIEVWSVKEGQQRFDSHVDKLMNYIRFWQANGESAKTSERVKTRLAQLTAEGKFIGGRLPYGYKLIPTGEISRKGRAIREVVVDEAEAKVVQEIYNLVLNNGYGLTRITKLLNSRGLKTHSGYPFSKNAVRRILRNHLYCGYFHCNDVVSPKQEHLAIIDENVFEQVRKIEKQRAERNDELAHIAKTTSGISLLSGNIFCGCCGSRLSASRGAYRPKPVDGSDVLKREYFRQYVCYNKVNHRSDCKGQTTYQAARVEKIVIEKLHSCFKTIQKIPKNEALKAKYEKSLLVEKQKIRELKNAEQDLEKQKTALADEIGKALTGTSDFSTDMLKLAINNVNKQLESNRFALAESEDAFNNVEELLSRIDYYYEQFLTWAKEFDTKTPEEKKMIICQLFKRITVSRGYEVDIELNEEYGQFL